MNAFGKTDIDWQDMPASPPHVHIHPHCGACNFTFNPGDRIVAICCFNGSSPVAVDAYSFRNKGHCEQSEQSPGLFCRRWNCQSCLQYEESTTIHNDCYNLYKRRAGSFTTLHRLWRADPEIDLSRAMIETAKQFDNPRFRLLDMPLELARLVWDYIQYPELARLCSTVCLVDLLHGDGRNENTQEITIPLDAVCAWERGEVSPTTGPYDGKSAVRLTFDVRGLRKIEHFEEKTAACEFRPPNLEFAVLEAHCLVNIATMFQYGLGRLRVPSQTRRFPIWDLPDPPRTALLPPPISNPTRLATIDTNTCTGLTFFISFGVTYAIHAHSAKDSHAIKTFSCLSTQRQLHVAWIYIPLAQGDGLQAFGIRKRRANNVLVTACFLLRKARAGDLVVGPWHNKATEDFITQTCTGSILIYDIHEQKGVNTIGVYPRVPGEVIFTSVAPTDEPPFRNACFSSASIENIRTLSIYRNRDGAYRGLLFEYEDGSKQTVGQCRLGLDSVQKCVRPSHLWFISTNVPLPNTERRLDAVEVDVTMESEHAHAEWRCCDMVGRIETWFTGEETRLNVV